ncbi:MAG: Holliday junction branch migration protein RuvA [Acetobacteraceae bacterium]
MIGRLVGHVVATELDHCLIDVNGVGYVVSVSSPTLSHLPPSSEKATLLIEMHVREDAIQLFGFASQGERAWFRTLTTVQGVGSKVALAILSVCPPETLPLIIASGDKAQLARAMGVGPRLASRIISELSAKTASLPESASVAGPTTPGISSSLEGEAMTALESLGFRRVEVWDVLTRIIKSHEGANLEKILGLTLKELGR